MAGSFAATDAIGAQSVSWIDIASVLELAIRHDVVVAGFRCNLRGIKQQLPVVTAAFKTAGVRSRCSTGCRQHPAPMIFEIVVDITPPQN